MYLVRLMREREQKAIQILSYRKIIIADGFFFFEMIGRFFLSFL